jgi:drug/metabolite transporter (DMT)-like permease
MSESTARVPVAAFGAVAVTIFLWASAFVGIRSAVGSFSPGSLALLRFLVASVVLLGMVLVTGTRLPRGRDVGRIALVGFLGITVYNLSLNFGSQFIRAGSISFLINTAPIWTAIFARVLLEEKLPPAAYLGFAISFGGVILIFSGEDLGGLLQPATVLIVVAAIVHSLYFVLQRGLLQRYTPLQVVAVAIWSGTLFMVPFAGAMLSDLQRAPASAVATVVYLGVFPGALAFASWSYALSKMKAPHAAAFLYCVPPVTIVVSWLALDEVPTLISLAGGAVALVGVMVVNRARSRGR